MKKRTLPLAILAGLVLLMPIVRAAWDATTPATNGPVVSAPIRANWTALQRTVGLNQARDSALEVWQTTTTAPRDYTLSGAGAAIVRTGTGEGDTTRQVGKYAAKITFGAATAKLCQDVYSTTDFDTGLRGRIVSLGWWVKTSTASQARVELGDGIGTTTSSFHSGGGSFTYLTATRTLDVAATKVQACANVEAAGAAYFSAWALVFGEVPPDDFKPPAGLLYDPNTGDLRSDGQIQFRPGLGSTFIGTTSGRIKTITTAVGNVGAGPDDLITDSVPAYTLGKDGQVLRFTFHGTMGSNGNLKTWTVNWGATSLTLASASPNGGSWSVVGEVTRVTATTQLMRATFNSLNGAGTVESTRTLTGSPTETLSGAVTLKMTGNGTANDDVRALELFEEIVG